MFYRAELDFLRATLEKNRMTFRLLPPQEMLKDGLDMGLRSMLGIGEKLFSACEDVILSMEQKKVYIYKDPFSCAYLFFLLPRSNDALLIGPFTEESFSSEEIMEAAEREKLPAKLVPELENYYGSIPFLDQGNSLFSMLEAFCDLIWKGDEFDLVEINAPKAEAEIYIPGEGAGENPLWKMELMEKRYEYENKMIEAVAKGQTHKLKLLFPIFSAMSFERRLSDSLRNMKNYCIIMNTLLRKAAEQGGVHPVFLDKISSEFARKIENMASVSAVQGLMMEMFDRYCRLVRKHSMKDYSPQVGKTIIAIESNLSTDLSLSTIAALLGITPSYLSKIFKKETGMNFTEYVNHRRISYASRLLVNTKLQIQTIAQHCGIMDVQYFSRLFKKISGYAPMEYRRMHPEKE